MVLTLLSLHPFLSLSASNPLMKTTSPSPWAAHAGKSVEPARAHTRVSQRSSSSGAAAGLRMLREEGEHPAASSPVALAWVPCAGELGRPVAIATAAKMLPPRRAGMQSVADSCSCMCGGRPAVRCPG